MKQNNQNLFSAFVRKIALAICFLGISTLAFAQSQVKGTVKDANGLPVIGATVIVDGTTTGTTTDANGQFVLKADDKATLTVSYLGFKDAQVTVAGKSDIQVTLEEDAAVLDDVVVVGYGTMRKSDLTGSTTQIKSEAITATVGASPLAALQGKSSGVAVFTNNQPGASPEMRIRGTGSINASNEPLYVVDGFPLMDGDLNDINPADIESMEILKDASSTAIYGSRGANGVVMITTKKGSKGTKNLSVNLNAGVQLRSRLVDLISGDQWIALNGGQAPANGIYTDWQKEIIERAALTQDYSVTFDGQSNGTSYMLSGGYYNQDGLIKAQGFEKFTVHSNLQHEFNNWLTVGSSIQFTTSRQNIFNNATSEIFRSASPLEPVFNEDGSYNVIVGATNFNPVADIAAQTNYVDNTRFIGNFFAEAKLHKNLTYKISIGYDTKTARGYKYNSSQTASAIVQGTGTGSGSHSWGKNQSKLMDHIVTYKNQWDDHRFSATAVYSYQSFKYEGMNASSNAFDNDLLGAWSIGGKELSGYGSNIYTNKIISFTGRLTYAYADKYLLTATARYDGSSRFGANNKWGLFPSVGIAWRATQEEFLKDNNVVTDLKIRASWGVTGNQEIGNYRSLARLSTAVGNGYSDGLTMLPGYGESVGNADLKWEKTTQIDLGFDLSLWDRLNMTFDYYNRETNDLLYETPIPSSSGFSSVMSNVGSVKNTGIEVTLGGDIYKNRDWKIDASVNFTYSVNEITELNEHEDKELNSGKNTGLGSYLKEGYPVNSVWGYKSMGIIKTEEQLAAYKEALPTYAAGAQLGDEMYWDQNGDGTLNTADYICFGSTEPKYFYGFNLGVQWKNLKLNVYGQGAWDYAAVAGGEANHRAGLGFAQNSAGQSDNGNYLMHGENSIAGLTGWISKDAYADKWSPSNPNGNLPRSGFNGLLSDRTNANWHYFILKNIQLSYDFTSLLKVKSVKKLTFSVNLQNFFTASTTNGYNPENGDVSNPFAKIVMFGVGAKF